MHIDLREPVPWQVDDQIVITSTSFDQEDTETARIRHVHENGTRIELEFPLQFEHAGDGWSASVALNSHSGYGWAEDGDEIQEYSAEVGLLSRNVVVEGDYHVSRRQEFGVQIVIASRGDLSATARISNTEVRIAGQGSKIGKYPIHFHMVGDVSTSFVKNSTVHHAFNRAIAIHGVNNLTLTNNVAYDTRGHALFIEDGTEVNSRLENNVVALVRPVLSLLLVDQSPACYWIVHPYTHMIGNVAAGSSPLRLLAANVTLARRRGRTGAARRRFSVPRPNVFAAWRCRWQRCAFRWQGKSA